MIKEDVIRHKKIRTAVYDEFGNLLKYEERDVELYESQEKHRTPSAGAQATPKKQVPPRIPLRGKGGYLANKPRAKGKLAPKGLVFCECCQRPVSAGWIKSHLASQEHKRNEQAATQKKRLKTSSESSRTEGGAENLRVKAQGNTTVKDSSNKGQSAVKRRRRDHLRNTTPRINSLLGDPTRPLDSSPVAQGVHQQPQNINNDFVVCSICGASLRKTNLRRHMDKVHSGPKHGNKSKAGIVKNKPVEVGLFEKEQDGSKNIGYLARERGRFGSYPMHDDYNDEGGAD